MKLFFDDAAFDGQLQRSVGKVDSGMANVGECLEIASQITPGDRDSWWSAWSTFATGLAEAGEEAARAGQHVTARGRYLRACEYHRQAFFWHRDDLDASELQSSFHASVAAMRAALPLLGMPAAVFDGNLPGYVFHPDSSGRFPTIIHLGGYDGTAEEIVSAVPAAYARGYAMFVVDGPGQGSVLYDRRIPMRPDWENVLPGLFDEILGFDFVDPDRVVVVGRSFGGLIGPRAASGDDRVAALVVDPGQYDLGAVMASRMGDDLWSNVDDPSADAAFEALLEVPNLAALFKPRMATHGVDTVRDYLVDLRRYHNRDAGPALRCPTFVADNETDLVSPGQGKELYDSIRAPKEFRRFTKAEGAEGHCEGMAGALFWDEAYRWLAEVLR